MDLAALAASLDVDLLPHLRPDIIASIHARIEWEKTALPHQRVPPGDWWSIWLMLAGRGAGKTRTAAETLRDWAWDEPETRWLVSAPTYADLEGTCYEGESGLMAVIPREMIAKYKKDPRPTIELTNGSLIIGISAENPERFRGPQFHGGWLDELAAWQYLQDAWDMIQFGMRLGKRVRLICSTTPKPKPLIRELLKAEGKDVVVTKASTYANAHNLAPKFKEKVLSYEGTTIGRQEIHAEVIDLEEAGIIKRSWLKLWPDAKDPPAFDLIVMSLDTAFTEDTRDKKTGDADPSACTVWGYWKDGEGWGALLLDAWQEKLGFPDLVKRTKAELKVCYGGDEQKPQIKPLIGPLKPDGAGRAPDVLIIEDKGSGISLRQTLYVEGIDAYPYNPGRASKVARLHIVSNVFAAGRIYVMESGKRAGQMVSWAEPVVEQLCTFTGEGSIPHDDYVDSTTQAIRYLVDAKFISVTEPQREEPEHDDDGEVTNPYAA